MATYAQHPTPTAVPQERDHLSTRVNSIGGSSSCSPSSSTSGYPRATRIPPRYRDSYWQAVYDEQQEQMRQETIVSLSPLPSPSTRRSAMSRQGSTSSLRSFNEDWRQTPSPTRPWHHHRQESRRGLHSHEYPPSALPISIPCVPLSDSFNAAESTHATVHAFRHPCACRPTSRSPSINSLQFPHVAIGQRGSEVDRTVVQPPPAYPSSGAPSTTGLQAKKCPSHSDKRGSSTGRPPPPPAPPKRPKKPHIIALLRTLSQRDVLLKLLPALVLSAARGAAPPLMARILGGVFNAYSTFSRASPPEHPLTGVALLSAKSALMGHVKVAALELVGLGVCVLLVGTSMFTLWICVGEQIARQLRRSMFYAVSAKPMHWFDNGMEIGRNDGASSDGGASSAGAAGLMARFARNSDEVRNAVSQHVGQIVTATTTTCACLGVAFASSWSLTLVILASIPLTLILTAVTMRIGRPLILAEYAAVERASDQVERTVKAIATVKAFNAQQEEHDRFRRMMATSGNVYMRSCACWATRLGLTSTVSLSMFVQGFWYGSYLVQKGTMTAGGVMTVFWVALVASTNMQTIMQSWTVLDKGMIAYSSIQNLLDDSNCHSASSPTAPFVIRIDEIPSTPPHSRSFSASSASITVAKNPSTHARQVTPMRKVRPTQPCRGEVVLRDVRFNYPSRPDVPVLNGVSMFFPAGETTFLLGRSGSGKSTIVQLLLRLYRPDSGSIELDSNEFAYLDPDWCRENIAAVTQSPIIFDMSARDNIALGALGKLKGAPGGKLDLSKVADDDIWAACRISLLHRFLRDLPQGFDTKLGSGGANLSGGQKQRLAISRAVLRDPTVLILDEAVSALDLTARLLVHEALKRWRKGRTTIVITHDISQVGKDDFVYVMAGGTVAQQGYRRDIENCEGPFCQMAQAMENKVNVSEPPSPTGLDQDARKSLRAYKRRGSEDGNFVKTLKRMSLRRGGTMAPGLVPPMPPVSSHALDPRSLKRRSVEPRGVLDRVGAVANLRRPKHVTRRPAPLTVTKLHHRSIQLAAETKTPEFPVSIQVRGAALVPTVRYAFASVPNKALLVLGFIIATIGGAVNPAFSVALGKLIATMGSTVDQSQVLLLSLIVLALALVEGLLLYMRYFVLEAAADGWIRKLRCEAYNNVLHQQKSWFDQPSNSAQRICQSIAKDGEDARKLIGQVLGNIWSSFVLLFAGLVCALGFGWQLTLLGIGFAIVLIAALCAQAGALNKLESINKAHREAVVKHFYSLAANMRGIRAMAIEPIFCEQFEESVESAYVSALRMAPLQALGSGLGEGLTYLAEAAIYALGAYLLASGTYDLSCVTITLNLVIFACTFSSQGVAFLPGLIKAVQAISDLRRLLELDVYGPERQGEGRFIVSGALTFQGVRFAYPSRKTEEVLKGITFTIQPGECIAIVGGSGCGKSTVAALLQRLYEPSSGSVLLDGRPLNAYDCGYLREHLAVVNQNPDLFDATVAENIAYGANRVVRPCGWAAGDNEKLASSLASRTNIEAAACAANVDEFVRSLPQGYATDLGNSASLVSGGQAQRLAIARAMVRSRARVLILDECTSALDAQNQVAVMETLFAKGRDAAEACRRREMTTVVITHKKEIMQMCDRIIVLQHGVVAQQGSYQQLIQQKGGAFTTLASAAESGA
ncbi:P-loop containing nucleoside triphosphate hydrolase protein [Tilletiaria anomala UBC 951]|uniref:p-loop containing nucleoside triphosphate hydrolase protein n=1 Tax=Tilletiaria anomala (strain ATCC 24038 / CBS 436.72 / UBC 951) TaxID=1037660 RepID=A0A066VZJ4_TILAU|nr:P-loop containing nucleoside triphosphate hydrolase protein [Tilletiaria anomala UBC 951]KDN47157.1 P-loop containing nucleoside triphosphate hydrolase protein [Tilletiaria anomala UBC 951]